MVNYALYLVLWNLQVEVSVTGQMPSTGARRLVLELLGTHFAQPSVAFHALSEKLTCFQDYPRGPPAEWLSSL